ncbi:MAG TPA: VOC family protein [Solirubrobacteraceae bacterium]|nr:VOC family protein [Solirubrobacteraceae bacterium]
MGAPVVHFEIIGKDAGKLQEYYGDLFGWEFDASNPMNYGVVSREQNLTPEGIGIGGGIGPAPEGYGGHVTFYVGVEDVEAALSKAESLGGTRVMGPETIMGSMILGMFNDPEGHMIGLFSQASDGS